ncbi:MAG TPA: amidohydrolase family protein [Atribacterota bacterium]|nr:amidohydrolase family protein [Atribacterota bacterium]
MEYTVLAGTLIDGRSNKPKRNIEITIENEKISQIRDQKDDRRKENNFYNIDATKYTILPGLIDSHVHIMMNPEYKAWHNWVFEEKEDLMLLKATDNLSQLLESGVTTIRECGAYGNISYALREAVELKYLKGPRLIISGSPITITGGHCYYMGIEADSKDELKKAVRGLNKKKVDFIKLMATGGSLTPQSSRRGIQYSYDEIRLVVEEAHLRGKKVAAHALCTKGIIDSAKAGVDTIEHCAWLDPEDGFIYDDNSVKQMFDRKIYINPCLPATAKYLSRVSPEEKTYLFNSRIGLLKKTFQAGVEMLAGTDSGVPEVGFNSIVESIKLLNEYIGLSKMQAIFAATINSANALGIGDLVGSIEVGKFADMMIVESDPLNNLDDLKKVVMVIKSGEIVYKKK